MNSAEVNEAHEMISSTVFSCRDGGVGVFASMQKPCAVLMHIIHVLGLHKKVKAFFADTGVHFPETLEMRDLYGELFGLEIISCVPVLSMEAQSQKYGRELHLYDDEKDAPGYKVCCYERKKKPLLAELRKHDIKVVFGALRKLEGGARASLQRTEFDDEFEVWKVHPLINWSDALIDEYLIHHKIPIHPLYAKSFLSIGCSTCTGPVLPGADPRSGRWPHLNLSGGNRYCAMNPGDRKK